METTNFKVLLSAAVLAATASTASAATISTDTTPDFSLYGISGDISNVAVVSGSQVNVFASPFADGTTDYYTVGSPGYTPSPAVLTLETAATSFSLLWGTIDSYNAVEFFLDGVSVLLVDGADLLLGTSGTINAAVSIEDIGLFDSVKFYSDFGNYRDIAAFEFALEVAPVPVPAAGLLLLGALGGLAALRRRKAV